MKIEHAKNILKEQDLDFAATLMEYSETLYEIRVGVFTTKEYAEKVADALNTFFDNFNKNNE